MADLNAASRFEKSLGLLTTRFVNLLQEARDGVLDLKVVSITNRQIIIRLGNCNSYVSLGC